MGVARTTGRHSKSSAERVDALVIRDVFCAENFLELGPQGLDAAVLPKRTFPYTRGRCGKDGRRFRCRHTRSWGV